MPGSGRRPATADGRVRVYLEVALREHGIQCSISRTGEVRDNSAMESFFSSMKTERMAHEDYRTRQEIWVNVFDYIEHFFNPVRRHSSLGYVCPIEFQKAQRA